MLQQFKVVNVSMRVQTVSCGIIHGLQISLAYEFADFCILAPTWRSGFLLSSVMSLYLAYIKKTVYIVQLNTCNEIRPSMKK